MPLPDPAAGRPLLLCLSHLRWDLVLQRPQHLLMRAARHWRVLFLEEARFAPPAPDLPRLHREEVFPGIEVAVPVLPYWDGVPGSVERQQRPLLDALFAELGQPDIAWYYTPLALSFTEHLVPRLTVYDCMDELSAFKGASPRLLLEERRLLARAGVVFTGGRSLFEAKRALHPNIHCFPSSIDAAHFAAARRPGPHRPPALPEPPELAALPHPRIGWFGVVDERMDLGLLDACAALRPDWSFVMLGPVVKLEEAELPRRRNLHWLGPRRYAELPAQLAHWDAGFMPFAISEATRFISPTKTPEYLAAGLPVVSTPIADVVRPWGEGGLVEIVRDPGSAVAALEHVMARPRGPWLARVDARLAGESWDLTWAAMLALLQPEAAGATRPDGGGAPRREGAGASRRAGTGASVTGAGLA